MLRRFLLLGAVLVLPLGLAAQRSGRAPATVPVQLIAFNDFHGNLEPPTGGNGLVGTTPAGGAEYLAAHLARAVAAQPRSIIVAAGDLVGASPLASGLFHDEPTIEALNAMNLSVSSVGNHEFDRGRTELLRLQNGGCHPTDGCRGGVDFTGARFQYLAANAVDERTRQPLLPATAVRAVDGVKIGFIGETLKGTKQIVSQAATAGLTFLDEATTANMYARQLGRQGVRAIVLLIHEGGRQAGAENDTDPNGCANFNGPIAAIARKLVPEIRVVVSGHSHRFYNCTIAGHLVTSAQSYGRMITRVSLGVERASGRVTSATAVNEVVGRDVAKDPVQTALVEKYVALARPLAGRVAGSMAAEISRRQNRAGESALGDVVADAHLASAAGGTNGAVIAFMNNSGIRADLVAAAAAAPGPRPVTYGELYSVQPFGNVVTIVTMTGGMIKRLLEQQFAQAGRGGEILQVSSGFSYRYRLDAPPGQHVDAASIALNGRTIGATDRVRVAVNDFLVGGGIGFTVFAEGTDKAGGELDVDAFAAYFKAHSPVSPGPQNRIVRTD